MRAQIIICLLTALSVLKSPSLFGQEKKFQSLNITKGNNMKNKTPEYLYKIVSMEEWSLSEKQKTLSLSKMDKEFIHLSTQEQLDRILAKFWSNVSQYKILKLKTSALVGDLRFEANPGGKNKYYHLYNGSIPMRAVVESKLINNNTQDPT